MQRAAEIQATILRRVAEIEAELRRALDDLKKLRTKDPATAEVVMRGARLSRERSDLERRLEVIQQSAMDAARPTNVARPSADTARPSNDAARHTAVRRKRST